MRDDPGGVFDSDEHRRVAGHLGRPRTVASLGAELHKDQSVSLTESELYGVLQDLEADGLVTNVGDAADGDALVAAVADSKTAIELPDEQAEILAERAQARPHLYLGGEQWVLTGDGLDKLNAPLPNEPPPLEGAALEAAKAADKARGVGEYAEEA